MAKTTSYKQLGTNVSFKFYGDTKVFLAFNDNNYGNNVGSFTFDIFLGTVKKTSGTVLGSHGGWVEVPGLTLQANKSYRIEAAGQIEIEAGQGNYAGPNGANSGFTNANPGPNPEDRYLLGGTSYKAHSLVGRFVSDRPDYPPRRPRRPGPTEPPYVVPEPPPIIDTQEEICIIELEPEEPEPPTTDIPGDPQPAGYSGTCYFKIDSLGAPCFGGINKNSISDFKIDSYYNADKRLNLNFKSNDPEPWVNRYITYTKSKPSTYNTTLTSGLSGNVPVYIMTGCQYKTINTTGLITTTGAYGQIQTCSGDIPTQVCDDSLPPIVTERLTGLFYSSSSELSNYSGTTYAYLLTGYFIGGFEIEASSFDSYLEVDNDFQRIAENDNWINSKNYDQISLKSLNLAIDDSAEIYDYDRGGNLKIAISKSSGAKIDSDFYKATTSLELLTGYGASYNKYDLWNTMAWASYNVTSGTNYKGAEIYVGFEIYDKLEIENGEFKISEFASGLDLPKVKNAQIDVRENFSTYCKVVKDCEVKEKGDVEVCYTGATTGQAYINFVSGVRKRFSEKINGVVGGSNEFFSENVSSGLFQITSGEIYFGDFSTGETIKIDSYGFNYPLTYSGIFDHLPSDSGFSLTATFGSNFSNISGLVDFLNTGYFNVTGKPIWYNYDCISPPSYNDGIYVTRSGIGYAKIKDFPIDDPNFNKLIEFYSMHNHSGGISVSYNKNDNRIVPSLGSLKYLLPSSVFSQYSNDGISWTNSQTFETGINWSMALVQSGRVTGLEPAELLSVLPLAKEEALEDITLIEPVGGYAELLKFVQSGYHGVPGCPKVSFKRDIAIVAPTGFAPDVELDEACQPKDSGEGEEEEEEGENVPEDYTGVIYNYSYLRTGFKFTTPDNSSGEYNYWRIMMSGLSSSGVSQELLSDSFAVKNINLFVYKQNFPSLHSGSTCVYDLDYTGRIQGHVPVQITGRYQDVLSYSDSGVKKIVNLPVLGPISDGLQSGDWVKFNNKSGRLLSSSGTGYITDNITGSGCFSYTETGHFYNPSTNIYSEEQELTSCFSESGYISGLVYSIGPQVIIRESLPGGQLDTKIYRTGENFLQFTGFVSANDFFSDLKSTYRLTGVTGGLSESGIFQRNELITRTFFDDTWEYLVENWEDITRDWENLVSSNIFADYGTPTGYINAESYLTVGALNIFDYIVINNKTVTYYSGQDQSYTSPDYFNNLSDLEQTINSNPAMFGASGKLINPNLMQLKSLVSGADGNLISVFSSSNSLSLSSSLLTGGKNLYQQVTPTGSFSGRLNFIAYKTGYYQDNSGSGFITGLINSFQGVRSFTGLWNLETGDFRFAYSNFREDNLILGNKYYNEATNSSNFTYPSVIDTKISYNNIYTSPTLDVAKLTISGVGTNSGRTYLLTGV